MVLRRFLAPLLFAGFLAGCASTNKIDALKPEPDDATPLVIEPSISFVSLPVSIGLKDIENQTNKYLNGLIYEDNNIKDDDIEMKVWKLAPIRLANHDGKIRTVLPLKAQVKYRIGTSKLGVDLYSVREFNLSGTISLLSSISMNNWQLRTKTSFEKITWNESPTTTVMGKSVPITYAIDPAVSYFKKEIEKSVDDAIAQNMDFQPNVLDALSQLSQPVKMNEAYETWFRIIPIELYATSAKLDKQQLSMDMGLKCAMETYIGKAPKSGFDRNKVQLKAVSRIPDQCTANVVAVSLYSDASRLISQNFGGMEFGSGSKKVKVNKVDLWHKAGKMVVALDLSGSITGKVYLNGVPKFDRARQEIYLDDVDYVLDTKNRLLRTANWLASGMVLSKIQEACRYSVRENIGDARKQMGEYLNNYSPIEGVIVNGDLGEMTVGRIELTNQAMLVILVAQAKVNVKIDGLN